MTQRNQWDEPDEGVIGDPGFGEGGTIKGSRWEKYQAGKRLRKGEPSKGGETIAAKARARLIKMPRLP